jgi:hypothetical protein
MHKGITITGMPVHPHVPGLQTILHLQHLPNWVFFSRDRGWVCPITFHRSLVQRTDCTRFTSQPCTLPGDYIVSYFCNYLCHNEHSPPLAAITSVAHVSDIILIQDLECDAGHEHAFMFMMEIWDRHRAELSAPPSLGLSRWLQQFTIGRGCV